MTATSPLRLMLWLKWTLIWRGYRKNRVKAVSTILSVLFLVPLSVFFAYAVHYLALLQPWTPPLAARDCLIIIYLVWAVTPLLGFSLNDSYDLTKLFVYPLTYGQIFLGSVVGSLLDLSVLLTLPTFVVLLALFTSSPAAGIVSLLIVLLFLIHTLALGQAITLVLIGFLRSRRFRDITVVVLPLLGIGYYAGQRLVFSRLERGSLEDLLDGPVWRALGWLPPGWAAAGLNAARDGDWLTALLNLGLLALVGIATLALAASALKALYLGDRGPLIARSALPSHPSATAQGMHPARINGFAGRLAFFDRFVPRDIAAVAAKEFLYIGREPQYKAMAMNAAYTLAVLALSFLLPAASHDSPVRSYRILGDWLLFVVSGTLLVALSPLLFNLWGGEGAAVTVLFSFPTRRRSILLGKNLAHGLLVLGLNGVGLTLVAAATGYWRLLPLALVWVLLATPLLLMAGNLVSSRFPQRMLVRGQRWSRGGVSAGQSGAGCAFAFLYMLAYLITFLVLLPVLAAVVVPVLLSWSPLWYIGCLPLALAYSITLYVVLLGQAESWLLARETEIVQKIVPVD